MTTPHSDETRLPQVGVYVEWFKKDRPGTEVGMLWADDTIITLLNGDRATVSQFTGWKYWTKQRSTYDE